MSVCCVFHSFLLEISSNSSAFVKVRCSRACRAWILFLLWPLVVPRPFFLEMDFVLLFLHQRKAISDALHFKNSDTDRKMIKWCFLKTMSFNYYLYEYIYSKIGWKVRNHCLFAFLERFTLTVINTFLNLLFVIILTHEMLLGRFTKSFFRQIFIILMSKEFWMHV